MNRSEIPRETAPRPRLAVTGASGLLGATFVNAARESFDVTAMVGRRSFSLPGVSIRSLDLRRQDATTACLDACRPDLIVHMAALASVDQCETRREEATLVNVEATRWFARWARENGAKMLFFSTDSVFDGRRGDYREEDETRPLNHYATTKVLAEEAVRAVLPAHLIVRAAFYGWNMQDKTSLAEWMLARLRTGERFPAYSDAIFTPLTTETLSDVMLQLLAANASGTFHLGSIDAISKLDFAFLLAREFDLPASGIQSAELCEAGSAATRPLNSSLCIDKARRAGLKAPTVASDIRRFHQSETDGFPLFLRSLAPN